jgi:RNA polymerase sigma-70 factor (ECF subfamily)
MRNGDGVRREAILREAVLAGDEVAWQAWYAESCAPLERYVLWRCGQWRDLAEDVLQDTWLTAVRSIRRFRPDAGTFVAWLRGIAANVIRQQLRQQRRQRRYSSLNAEPAVNGSGHSASDRGERIARTLDALSERHEAVLRAKYLDELTVEQIALAWSESAKAVESLLTRARIAFREAYGPEAEQP